MDGLDGTRKYQSKHTHILMEDTICKMVAGAFGHIRIMGETAPLTLTLSATTTALTTIYIIISLSFNKNQQ